MAPMRKAGTGMPRTAGRPCARACASMPAAFARGRTSDFFICFRPLLRCEPQSQGGPRERRAWMRKGMNPDLYREEWQWQEGDSDGHAQLPVVGARLSSGVQRAVLHQGRQAGENRGRSALAGQRGQAVHALPGHGGGREPSRPHPASAAPRGRARREQVGRNHYGRGVCPHCGKGARGDRGIRSQVHRHGHRHGPQRHVADVVFGLRRLQDPQRHGGHAFRRLLLHAAPAGHERHLRVRLHRRLRAAFRRALRRSGVPPPRRHPQLGLQPGRLQRGRLLRALDRRLHAARLPVCSWSTRA